MNHLVAEIYVTQEDLHITRRGKTPHRYEGSKITPSSICRINRIVADADTKEFCGDHLSFQWPGGLDDPEPEPEEEPQPETFWDRVDYLYDRSMDR